MEKPPQPIDLDELRELLTGVVDILGKKTRRNYGSPDHCHALPGIWDDDNGELAGKPCAECALYDRVRYLAASLALQLKAG